MEILIKEDGRWWYYISKKQWEYETNPEHSLYYSYEQPFKLTYKSDNKVKTIILWLDDKVIKQNNKIIWEKGDYNRKYQQKYRENKNQELLNKAKEKRKEHIKLKKS